MRTLVDLCFQRESSSLSLRYRCDDCAHFDEVGERCAHGYPTEAHRARQVSTGGTVVFCKEFELGGVAES